MTPIGVAIRIGLAMLRVLLNIPIRWILIPGYVMALVLSRMVPKIFVGIAFDSGGVASGPMTSTFLLPLSIGSEEATGYWGLGVQEEKEIVLILADAESKAGIMRAIGEHCGMHSEAKGLVTSLPIDSVMGL